MIRKIISLLLVLAVSLGIGSVFATEAPNEMSLSEKGALYLKRDEGFSETPYWDYSQWTVGFGSRCPDEKLEEYKKNGIPKAEAEELFKSNVASFEKAVNNFIKRNSLKVSQPQFDMLVCFSYNVGSAWMLHTSSTLRQAILNGETGSKIVNELVQWSKAGGNILPELVARRLRDANLYLNGDYTTKSPSEFGHVYYSANGGYVKEGVQGFVIGDESVVMPYATYDGREFLGWYTEPSGGTKVSNLTKNLVGTTLYAQWDSSNDTNKGLEEPVNIKVTGNIVNLREGHGINFKSIGTADKGDKLTITEVREGTGYTWGKSEKGWICLRYTNYTDVINGVVEPEVPENVTEPESTEPTNKPVENPTEPEDNHEANSTPNVDKETSDTSNISTSQKGIVKVNDALRIRKGPSISFDTVGYLYGEDAVEIFETKDADNMTWGRIGNEQWVSLTYVQIVNDENSEQAAPNESVNNNETNNAETNESNDVSDGENNASTNTVINGHISVDTYLRIRKDAGLNGDVVDYYYNNDTVSVSELKVLDSITWGKTEKGWISMDYVNVDIHGKIIADCLRVRKNAGTNNAIVGYLFENSDVSISRIKLVDKVQWGKTSRGWISMEYVK